MPFAFVPRYILLIVIKEILVLVVFKSNCIITNIYCTLLEIEFFFGINALNLSMDFLLHEYKRYISA